MDESLGRNRCYPHWSEGVSRIITYYAGGDHQSKLFLIRGELFHSHAVTPQVSLVLSQRPTTWAPTTTPRHSHQGAYDNADEAFYHAGPHPACLGRSGNNLGISRGRRGSYHDETPDWRVVFQGKEP